MKLVLFKMIRQVGEANDDGKDLSQKRSSKLPWGNKQPPVHLEMQLARKQSADDGYSDNAFLDPNGEDVPRYSPGPTALSHPPQFPDSSSSGYLEEALVKRDVTIESYAPSPIRKGETGGEVRLPFDETDYLQPQSAAPASYLELVNDWSTPGNRSTSVSMKIFAKVL